MGIGASCDACRVPASASIAVTVIEIHPHNGSELRVRRYVCGDCAARLALETPGPLPILPPVRREEGK